MRLRPRQCSEITNILISSFLIPFPTLECQSDCPQGAAGCAVPGCLGLEAPQQAAITCSSFWHEMLLGNYLKTTSKMQTLICLSVDFGRLGFTLGFI